jgi:Ca2+-binding EF-hand superfamily protein
MVFDVLFFVICACPGFYPSQEQIQDVYNEVEHSLLQHEWQINFEQFVKLYVNHRPVFHVGKDEIRAAFKVLGGDSGSLTRDALLTKLMSTGEKMSEKELIVCFQALLGQQPLTDTLPRNFTADNFAIGMLGFEDYEAGASA